LEREAMLDRSRPPPSPGAARARRSRARAKAGIGTFRIRAHTRRLLAVMVRANPELSDDLDQQAIETELSEIVAAIVERWIKERR
jgi:hypothetical protein